MDVEEALKILAMSEQERYQNGIVNSVEAIKRVKNEIDFLTRCLEGLKKQILELFHEKKELEKKIERIRRKPQQEYDKELMNKYNKLLANNNALESWYKYNFEDLKEYVDEFNSAYQEFIKFMESRKPKDGD